MYTNFNNAINGAPITDMSVAPFPSANLIAAQSGDFDSAKLLTSFLNLDPNRNMMLLHTKWDEQILKKESFASTMYRKVVSKNAILNVNGQDGGFKYKMAVDTDNCLRTVEDTSDQASEGFVGMDGTPFRMVLNKNLSPNQVIAIDPAYNLYLVVADIETQYLGYGYEIYFKLLGSEQDKDLVYEASWLKADIEYKLMSGSFITEYTEKLGISHLPDATRYIESEFKLGSGQGFEHWFTGKADSYKMNTGYTTSDTQKYLKEVMDAKLDPNNPLGLVKITTGEGNTINTIADLMEILTVRNFNDKFNLSLMFMPAAKVSTSKGVIEFNEGAWQQMRRGKRYTYAKKGGFNEADLVSVRNYVYQYNTSDTEDTFLHLETGSELGDNIERIIAKHGQNQINVLAPLLGQERVTDQRIVTGTLKSLAVAPVKITSAYVPGVGKLTVSKDRSLDYITGDVRTKGINAGGKDITTYSGYIYDVTSQYFSSNATLPTGTVAVGGETHASHNMYLVRPERNSVVWGRTNGRYDSRKASEVIASGRLMGEGFFIYGFGALWMPDPSKFVSIEVKNKLGIR